MGKLWYSYVMKHYIVMRMKDVITQHGWTSDVTDGTKKSDIKEYMPYNGIHTKL